MFQFRLLAVAVLCVLQNVSVFAVEDAGQAMGNAPKAGSNASGSAAHSISMSGRAVSAAISTPLSMGGVAVVSGGAASIGVANESRRVGALPIGKPLKITDEVITITPPNEALKNKDEKKSERKD